ncbi:SCO family protein [Lentibacillus amyloliquefaciens]|uniref:Cytochrome c oxidase assembly protein n=1 Tax=Lentibacillus amyloliquefaciens TaxID=1472767 RepID=A0A0U4E736_9BACI|nr:SCO family protein [Lentibacillus amyloliquefaciens]ALX49116.1 cytochrome c oxidase assembly protein [Lentibacillus amyloliquefaciens]
MKRLLFMIFVMTLFLTACGEDIETNMSEDVQDFEFTTQDNETLSLNDLKGEWWIADFIFTNCTTVCLPMTSNMSELQNKMKEENLDARLVSFSVDPDDDTPEVLKEYAKSYQADFSNWSFLTGYDFQTIKEFSIKSFRSIVESPPEGSDQVTHGTSFFLVNPKGKVIKRYSGIESKEMDNIIQDFKTVLK